MLSTFSALSALGLLGLLLLTIDVVELIRSGVNPLANCCLHIGQLRENLRFSFRQFRWNSCWQFVLTTSGCAFVFVESSTGSKQMAHRDLLCLWRVLLFFLAAQVSFEVDAVVAFAVVVSLAVVLCLNAVFLPFFSYEMA